MDLRFTDFDDLFATVAFMLYKNPEAVFITSYEPRRYRITVYN